MADGGVGAGQEVSMYEQAEVAMSDKIAGVLRGLAEGMIKNGTNDILPHLVVMGFGRPEVGSEEKLPENSMVFALASGFNTDLEKQIALRNCARSVLEADVLPVAVGLLSEAWTVDLAPGERLGTLQVADREDRTEAAVIFVGSVGRKVSRIMSCHVERDVDGKIVIKPRPDGSFDWLLCEKSESQLISNFWRAVAIAWNERKRK